MKNRAALVLMEQLVVILVFSLAAALCLLAFSQAHRISAETALQDRAVELAITGCEVIKAHRGNPDGAAAILEGEEKEDHILVIREDLYMKIHILSGEIPGLGRAKVEVFQENTDNPIYSLTTLWQEVLP